METKSSLRARLRPKTLPARRGDIDRIFAHVADCTPPKSKITKVINLPPGIRRPRTRAECHDVPRPCPWVSCKWHLYLDVNPENGTIKFNHPGRDPLELEESCALDIAEEGGMNQAELAPMFGLTDHGVGHIEREASKKIRGALPELVEPDRLLRIITTKGRRMADTEAKAETFEERARRIARAMESPEFQTEFALRTAEVHIESSIGGLGMVARRILRQLGYDMTGIDIRGQLVPAQLRMNVVPMDGSAAIDLRTDQGADSIGTPSEAEGNGG